MTGGNNSTGGMNLNLSSHDHNNVAHSNKNRICRDFNRGLCRRKYCRYPHVLSPDQVIFCHDFQNSTCPRVNCKFLHYTLQEEEYYRKFGEFPQDFPRDNNNMPTVGVNVSQCKEQTLYGNCRHRDCCLSVPVRAEHTNSWSERPTFRTNEHSMSLNEFRTTCEEFQAIKRSSRESIENASFKRFREDTERLDIIAVIRRFEEDQIMLRRRVEANEIKIAELRASNEYLIAQNTQLRLNNVQCSNIVNPVTVTQTTSQPQTAQVMGGVSIAPVQVQATPIVSIATPQTQIIANSAAPLAIANTSQGQQLTIAQQNISSLSSTSQPLAPTHAQQILGTSQITLAPALAQAPSMGLTINTSQALAMSNATQPIISYPVMTHSILPH